MTKKSAMTSEDLKKLDPNLKMRIGGEVIDFTYYKDFLLKVGNPVLRAANIHYERSLTYEEAARQVAKMAGLKQPISFNVKWLLIAAVAIMVIIIALKGNLLGL